MILCLKKINAIIVNVYKFPHLISEKNNSPSLYVIPELIPGTNFSEVWTELQ